MLLLPPTASVLWDSCTPSARIASLPPPALLPSTTSFLPTFCFPLPFFHYYCHHLGLLPPTAYAHHTDTFLPAPAYLPPPTTNFPSYQFPPIIHRPTYLPPFLPQCHIIHSFYYTPTTIQTHHLPLLPFLLLPTSTGTRTSYTSGSLFYRIYHLGRCWFTVRLIRTGSVTFGAPPTCRFCHVFIAATYLQFFVLPTACHHNTPAWFLPQHCTTCWLISAAATFLRTLRHHPCLPPCFPCGSPTCRHAVSCHCPFYLRLLPPCTLPPASLPACLRLHTPPPRRLVSACAFCCCCGACPLPWHALLPPCTAPCPCTTAMVVVLRVPCILNTAFLPAVFSAVLPGITACHAVLVAAYTNCLLPAFALFACNCLQDLVLFSSCQISLRSFCSPPWSYLDLFLHACACHFTRTVLHHTHLLPPARFFLPGLCFAFTCYLTLFHILRSGFHTPVYSTTVLANVPQPTYYHTLFSTILFCMSFVLHQFPRFFCLFLCLCVGFLFSHRFTPHSVSATLFRCHHTSPNLSFYPLLIL